jgi:hypothetical protein
METYCYVTMDMKSLAVSWIPAPVDCCYVGWPTISIIIPLLPHGLMVTILACYQEGPSTLPIVAINQRIPTFFGIPPPFRKKILTAPFSEKKYTPTPVLEINNVTHSFPTLWGHSPLFQTVIRWRLS